MTALKAAPAAQDLLAKLYFRLGVYPRAIELYQEIARQFPDRIAFAAVNDPQDRGLLEVRLRRRA